MKSRPYPALAAAIAATGMTQAELAEALGDVSTSTVSAVLRGQMRPSATLRARFAVVLGVSEDDLFEPHPDLRQLLDMAHAAGLDHLVVTARGVA